MVRNYAANTVRPQQLTFPLNIPRAPIEPTDIHMLIGSKALG